MILLTYNLSATIATQLPESETAILLRPSIRSLILAGDHKQLPPTVISTAAKKCYYDRSLFERLYMLQNVPVYTLDTQYRMRPEISEFPRRMFYEGELKDS